MTSLHNTKGDKYMLDYGKVFSNILENLLKPVSFYVGVIINDILPEEILQEFEAYQENFLFVLIFTILSIILMLLKYSLAFLQ